MIFLYIPIYSHIFPTVYLDSIVTAAYMLYHPIRCEGSTGNDLLYGWEEQVADDRSAAWTQARAHGPRQDLPSKISQARCPRQGLQGLIYLDILGSTVYLGPYSNGA